MKLFATALLAGLLTFASPVQAQQKGDHLMTMVICEQLDDALVGASEGAHKGLEALKAYLADPDNSCALVIPPVEALFERDIKKITGKEATMQVIEIKSLDGVATAYAWRRIHDVSI